jgi:hypothetical protein
VGRSDDKAVGEGVGSGLANVVSGKLKARSNFGAVAIGISTLVLLRAWLLPVLEYGLWRKSFLAGVLTGDA